MMPTNRIAENFFGTLGQLSVCVVRATVNGRIQGPFVGHSSYYRKL